MSCLSSRQQRRIKRSIAKEVVKSKRKKIMEKVTSSSGEEEDSGVLPPRESVMQSSYDSTHYYFSTAERIEKMLTVSEENDAASYQSFSGSLEQWTHENNGIKDNTSDVSEDISFLRSDCYSDNINCENDNVSVSVSDIESDTDSFSDVTFSNTSNESIEDDTLSTVSLDSVEDNSVCCYTEEKDLTAKLYRGADISQHEFSIAFLSMFHQHGLTYSCGSDILKILNQFLPSPNLVVQSPLGLIEQLVKFSSNTTTHHCCGYCTQILLDDSTCTRNECKSASLPNSSFIKVHLDKQLQKYFTDPHFMELLKYRFTKPENPNICDIYDGKMYKKFSEFFSTPFSISLSVNYDGAPKFRSSNMQIWPVQVCINELPPRIRFKKEYILLAGLWCAYQKPPAYSFLEPVLSCLNSLECSGVQVDIPGFGQKTIQVKLLCAILDLPAKASLLNCNQYNGSFGCNTCKHPGVSVSVGRGRSMVYPFDGSVVTRTHETHKVDARNALTNQSVVHGVKGFSPLHVIRNFLIPECMPVDYMHCALLGIAKKLARLWFDSTFHQKEWYIGKKSKEVDARLLSIHLPSFIARQPRSINDRKFWKASEWKNFLLFYIPAVLPGILPDKFLAHVFLLIKSIRIMLSSEIIEEDLNLCDTLLEKFNILFENYYGIANCSINVHLSLHLPYYVRNLGPLWSHSAFGFENCMQDFLRHSHATRNIGKQIVESHLLKQALIVEQNKLLTSSSCSSSTRCILANYQRASDHPAIETNMLGQSKSYLLSESEVFQSNELLESHGREHLVNNTVSIYLKAEINGKMFTSTSYKRGKRQNNHTISFHDPALKFALIDMFLCANKHHLAAVTKLNTCKGISYQISPEVITEQSRNLLFENYFTYVHSTRTYIFTSQIVGKCINLSTETNYLLTEPVNHVEVE